MTATPQLGHRFVDALPELGAPWQAMTPPDPAVAALNEPLARDLGLDPEWLRSEAGVGFLVGTALPEGSQPVAQVYAGHQFGAYSPRLGDGRALLLGEITDPRGGVHDIHLKGSGRTPFARADGFAVLGPMLREYVISEAMHALGIPTTRSLAVTATGARVLRDWSEPGAVLTRVAASHLRVGTVQYAASTRDAALLRRVADAAVEWHYPHLAEAENRYLALYEAVIETQAALTAQWMLVGFVHGVMNTDNVTLSGETIDYGPCAFMDRYDPAAAFSSIDHAGRYAYGAQPRITQWNLARLADALLPLLDDEQERAIAVAEEALAGYPVRYGEHWASGMRRKLGIQGADASEAASIATELLSLLHAHRVDYTGAFRALAAAAGGNRDPLRELVAVDLASFEPWLDRWLALRPDAAAMNRVNPAVIPRNHLVDEALEAATAGDLEPFERLVDAVSRPFEERTGFERYALPAPPDAPPFRTYCGT